MAATYQSPASRPQLRPREGSLRDGQPSSEARVRTWGRRGTGKVGATEDTTVWRRGQMFWQGVRTQKGIWEGRCWTELDAYHVLISGRTDGHGRQLERKAWDTRETKKQTEKERWKAGSHLERGDPRSHETAEEETGERGDMATTRERVSGKTGRDGQGDRRMSPRGYDAFENWEVTVTLQDSNGWGEGAPRGK